MHIYHLITAKSRELIAAGLASLKETIKKTELGRRCRRKTRGTGETKKCIEKLMLEFTGATDVLGVTLFNKDMVGIGTEQCKHMSCIQDPPNIPLYTRIDSVHKNGVILPVYRCARGSNSLESFHRHLLNFIPGTSANAVNFQAFFSTVFPDGTLLARKLSRIVNTSC